MGRRKNLKHSEETKKKISKSLTGRKLSEETKKKVSENSAKYWKGKKREPFSEEWKKNLGEAHSGKKNGFYGEHHSEETKRKISEANKGRKRSKKVREKMSEAKKGIKFTKEHRENMSKARKGEKKKPFSKKHKRKMSEARKGRIGEKAPNWKGGITSKNGAVRNSIEYQLWREAVFARDNWTCQKTGVKGGKLNAHHIQDFSTHPELRTSIENGITLSRKAHRKFHSIYGKRDNTKDQLEEFLNNLVKIE